MNLKIFLLRFVGKIRNYFHIGSIICSEKNRPVQQRKHHKMSIKSSLISASEHNQEMFHLLWFRSSLIISMNSIRTTFQQIKDLHQSIDSNRSEFCLKVRKISLNSFVFAVNSSKRPKETKSLCVKNPENQWFILHFFFWQTTKKRC